MLIRRHTILVLAVLLSLSGCKKLFKKRGAPDAGALSVTTRTVPTATSSSGGLDPADPTLAKGFSLHTRDCGTGDMVACNDLGIDYQEGRGTTKDYAAAVDNYKKACDGKIASGCSNLGAMYSDGHGVPKDEKTASGLYKTGCDGGSNLGCNNLGMNYRDGLGGLTKDDAKAVGLFTKACDHDYASACTNLG
ncbi:MAG TPA: tetratricopeptide repeat protein, partial [Polyangiaceae bacterium]